MKCVPMKNRFFCEYIDTKIDKQSAIIYIPEDYRLNCRLCRVVECPRTVDYKTTDTDLRDIKKNDIVLIEKEHTGFEFNVNNKKVINVHGDVIQAIVTI